MPSAMFGNTLACKGPISAAMPAVAPHTNTTQNTLVCPISLRKIRAGTIVRPQIRSLRNAWLPRPSAKNE